MVRGLAQPFAARLFGKRADFCIVPLDRTARQLTIRGYGHNRGGVGKAPTIMSFAAPSIKSSSVSQLNMSRLMPRRPENKPVRNVLRTGVSVRQQEVHIERPNGSRGIALVDIEPRIFGYLAEEIIGKPITILIPPDHQKEEEGIIERIRRGQRVEHFETVRQRKHGSLIDVSLTISPVKNAQGKIIGASKIARDITEHKRREAQIGN
jgi:PAS domain S-box-containing protein